ncbi:unnamed protein product [Mytilus coruscus]|uniref:Reverse transcriptase zinc-binding domain-containing protein n=1 Tax=Mytilus coruscus TaxID=42192 RepID=A0A6J8CG91_MYTCO|nr:unnamed protein product [Mytilus coruscus]
MHICVFANVKLKKIGLFESGLCDHADDTTLSFCNKESIPEVFKEFDLYSKATGVNINKQKSEILCVGNGQLSGVEKEQFGLQICKDAIQLLGVYAGPNKSLCDDMNWKNKIKKARSLLNMWLQRQLTLQEEWKNTIDTNVHHRNMDRTIDISVLIKNVPCDLKSCNVKKLYQCLLEDIIEEPIGPIIWKKLYALDEAELCKIWKHVYVFWKPSKMIELDYKIIHNCVFTNVKLKKIGLSDSELCDVCNKENEDIMHISINCDELEDVHYH